MEIAAAGAETSNTLDLAAALFCKEKPVFWATLSVVAGCLTVAWYCVAAAVIRVLNVLAVQDDLASGKSQQEAQHKALNDKQFFFWLWILSPLAVVVVVTGFPFYIAFHKNQYDLWNRFLHWLAGVS